MKAFILSLLVVGLAYAQNDTCPAVTVADNQGVVAGAYPQQYELSEFQELATCELSFSANPAAEALNAQLIGNPALPTLAERLPAEPLVVAPYDAIGQYGGMLNVVSKATESGSSDVLSLRHVNLVRYSDDLQTIVPNIAKGWQWNDDFTELTFYLRAGHKWSDGAPFTADDIVFWYNNIILDSNMYETPKENFLVDGEPMVVEAVSATEVRFSLPSSKPGLLTQFAVDYAQPFLPQHFLGQFHPAINADADTLAQAAGFETGYDVIEFYYGRSDWKDVPSPLLKDADKIAALPAAVVPTLEAFIVVRDTPELRHLVANPYFHMVDTQGQQLPYINEIDEIYLADENVQDLKLINGDIDYKTQAINLSSAPNLLDNQGKGDYRLDLPPTVGRNVAVSFNLTAEDEARRAVFNDIRFRQAMSVAINRQEIIDIAYLGEGAPRQFTPFDPNTVSFITDEQMTYLTEYDPAQANALLDEVGLVDVDGDGFRNLPNGDSFQLNIQFSSQGTPVDLPEIIANNWSQVGIKTIATEVTSDEYRAAQSSNELDVHIWYRGVASALLAGNPGYFIPPFDDYFGHRNGLLWEQYQNSNGAEGVAPPANVAELEALIKAYQGFEAGSAESNELGNEIVQKELDRFFFIGTVGNLPAPVYVSNSLHNVPVFTAKTYDYYWSYPYRPQQWFFVQ